MYAEIGYSTMQGPANNGDCGACSHWQERFMLTVHASEHKPVFHVLPRKHYITHDWILEVVGAGYKKSDIDMV